MIGLPVENLLVFSRWVTLLPVDDRLIFTLLLDAVAEARLFLSRVLSGLPMEGFLPFTRSTLRLPVEDLLFFSCTLILL